MVSTERIGEIEQGGAGMSDDAIAMIRRKMLFGLANNPAVQAFARSFRPAQSSPSMENNDA